MTPTYCLCLLKVMGAYVYLLHGTNLTPSFTLNHKSVQGVHVDCMNDRIVMTKNIFKILIDWEYQFGSSWLLVAPSIHIKYLFCELIDIFPFWSTLLPFLGHCIVPSGDNTSPNHIAPICWTLSPRETIRHQTSINYIFS